MALGDIAAGLGLPCFPCNDKKQPVVATGFKAATRDRAAILEAFAKPSAVLIGVPTGEVSGFVVIDIDIRDDRTGMDWLNAHSTDLPPTRTHKTRSGGLHLLFCYPAGHDIPNSAGRIAPGIDVRGNGGYVVFPPSPGYRIADDHRAAEMPDWLIRACVKQVADYTPPVYAERAPPRQDGGSRYGLAALERECDAVRTAPFGQQEFTMNAAGLKIGALVAGGELQEGIALAELQAAGRQVPSQGGKAPWAADEIRDKIKRAFDTGMSNPRKAPPGRPAPVVLDDGPPPDPWADPGYVASQAQDAPLSPDEWEDMQRRIGGETVPATPEGRAAAASKPAMPPKALLWSIVDGWDEAAIPMRPWLAKGYLMRGAVSVVSGPGSAGKSSLMVAWAVALVIGCAFGRFKVPGQLRVATYNVEDDADEQKRRFSAMLGVMGLKPPALEGRLAILGPEQVGTLLVPGRDGGVLLNTPVMDRLLAFLDKFAPDVLILDPFVELHAAEENDNTAVRAVMAAFRHVAAERNISVVLLHHARKGVGTPGDPDSLRGASSIVGAARVALTLNVMTEDEAKGFNIRPDARRNYFRLDGAKSNYAPVSEAEWFERQERRLANGAGGIGDGVAVAWPWTPPNMLKDAPAADLNAVLNRIHEGYAPGVPYSLTRRGNSNQRWVGTIIAQMLQGTDEQAKEIVGKWKYTGLLYEVEFRDPTSREPAKGVAVDFNKRPGLEFAA